MAFNQEFYARVNIRNHPAWREGYNSNVEGQEYPDPTWKYLVAFRLGWIHAEEDKILSEYAKDYPNGEPT